MPLKQLARRFNIIAHGGVPMSRVKEAKQIMAEGKMNCAQAVLTAFCEELGMQKEMGRRLASGFGGGMARTNNTCGAVTGAFMVLGLREYPEIKDPRERLEKVYAQVKEFRDKFIEENGSIHCSDLVGYDLSTADGLSSARENKAFFTVCPKFVEDAVNILENL
jgi:C_GCAxxG_C_C family probable redox protein